MSTWKDAQYLQSVEMQMKTTMSCYCTTPRLVEIKRLTIQSVDKDVEYMKFSYIDVKNVK